MTAPAVDTRTSAADESLLRINALRTVLAACEDGRYPADPALVSALAKLARAAATWASVARRAAEAGCR